MQIAEEAFEKLSELRSDVPFEILENALINAIANAGLQGNAKGDK